MTPSLPCTWPLGNSLIVGGEQRAANIAEGCDSPWLQSRLQEYAVQGDAPHKVWFKRLGAGPRGEPRSVDAKTCTDVRR